MTITIRKLHLAIAVLAVALLAPATALATHVFDDVDDARFYSGPVGWAADNAITTGKTPTIFDPEGNVTRGESVTFLNRYDTNIAQPALADLAGDISTNSANIAALQAPVPAFHARVSQNTVPGGIGVIIFDEEVLDAGDDYDPTTGTFTAPVDGIYDLSFVTVFLQSDGVIKMVKNGDTNDPLASTWADDGGLGVDIPASMIVTAELAAGDTITIARAFESGLWGRTNNGPFTYFSGHLVQAS